MKIQTIGVITGMSGKLNKSEKLVFSNRYDNVHAWEMNNPTGDPTEAQLAHRELFAQTITLVTAEMNDATKKAEWQAVADNSNGKWKTARGAAFASIYASLKTEDETVDETIES